MPAGLAKVAKEIPLVILSNSMTDLIPHSVAKLGAPFHAAYTAQEAQAYKPRMQAFEYMFDQLGCGFDHGALGFDNLAHRLGELIESLALLGVRYLALRLEDRGPNSPSGGARRRR